VDTVRQLAQMLILFLILHAGDGYIRRSSFDKIARQASKGLTFDCVSDLPLGGQVTSLHFVQHERTKERFLLGGADDGSIAFWELE
jgi:WD repeat-containing protein 7